MIKLTLYPDTQPLIKVFSKSCVIIGNSSCKECDLTLPDERLDAVHIKILEQNGRFVAINQANDPFVTLNGFPFGKKSLNNLDLLLIGKTPIRFEGSSSTFESDQPLLDTTHHIQPILDKIISPQNDDDPPFSIGEDDDLQGLNSEFLDGSALVEEVENLVEEKQPPPIAVKKHELQPLPFQPANYQVKLSKETPSSKKKGEDYFLTEFDEENEGWKFDKEEKAPVLPLSARLNWKLIVGIILALLFIIAAVAGSLYMKVSDKSGEEEIKAAEGVADVAMALTYARINHIKPQKHNWSDPDFLKNNLAAVLTSDYPSLANIDSHGQFCNCNYILRIYTSSDFTHFVVIAQPSPSLKQWLIPKSAIVVDSNLMELRRVDNLKGLNRLLVNPNVLDDSSADEVTLLVKEGELIPLQSLAYKKKDKGFSPPKYLALIYPGAQNLIYNSPRYFHLGEGIMKRALSMMENPGRSHEINRLKQEIEMMSNLPHMVLYSTKGIQLALDAQRALATFVPQGKFLTAYFQYNSLGEIVSSHLLMDDENEQLAFKKPEPSESAGSLNVDQILTEVRENDLKAPTDSADEFDEDDPLVYQLKALSSTRQMALKGLTEELVALLNHNNDGLVVNFNMRFRKLVDEYDKKNKDQQELILKELLLLYHENKHMPVNELMQYVKAANLEGFIKELLRNQMTKIGKGVLTTSQVELQMQKIQAAENFEQLDQSATEMSDQLNLDRLPDLELIIPFQTNMRSIVLQKLNQFLLSPDSSVSSLSFSAEDRDALGHVLKLIWVTEQEEYDFFLNEFDLQKEETNEKNPAKMKN